ncbi:Cation channel sperm-associated protein 1 [Durusdinium trenchii]|uniref:Cation channel sperm-associated protein 1 n=1 Tax=Durusdinium trenchii TaxID=1381693 RepID=A0ABP0KF11_9DINO
MLDSEADFEDRATAIGISTAELAQLKVLNYNTFGRLAFAANYVPGQADDAPLRSLAASIVGIDPAPADRMAVVGRIRVESHRLIDTVYQMAEEGQLRYVKWEDCAKRDQELMGFKTDPIWRPDSNGVVKEVRWAEDMKADFTTDLKLRLALQRRSLAFDQSRLVDYEDFKKWTQILIEAYTSSPPSGYGRISLEQVHRADLELFKHMMRSARGGVKVLSGIQPMKTALQQAIVAPEVRLCLQPLQGSTRQRESHDEDANKVKKLKAASSDNEERLKRQIQNLQGQIKNLQSGGSAGKGRGKGKTKNKLIRMPLIGMSPTTEAGEPICFDFNLSGCSKAKPGDKCPEGYHTCMRPGCNEAHSQKQRPGK